MKSLKSLCLVLAFITFSAMASQFTHSGIVNQNGGSQERLLYKSILTLEGPWGTTMRIPFWVDEYNCVFNTVNGNFVAFTQQQPPQCINAQLNLSSVDPL